MTINYITEFVLILTIFYSHYPHKILSLALSILVLLATTIGVFTTKFPLRFCCIYFRVSVIKKNEKVK